jgi:probable LLM family oxidoreductase
MAFEFGLDTFGERTRDANGLLASHAETLRQVVAQGELADRVGLDFFGVGEHHRDDFAVSAPEVVLAAIAARTSRIHLGTAVTVLSSDDPIRVFQRFATLDAVSNGRAEAIVGRGSFTESFPLFGLPLSDYERLFEEKLELFARARAATPITWSGTVRPPLRGQAVYPPVEGRLLPTWVGVGGTPASVVRAARHGFSLMLAIIGGEPVRFKPFVEVYLRALAERGEGPRPIGVHAPGHVADTDAQAREQLWPHYFEQRSRIGAERGWPPPTRAQFEREADVGAVFVGSPETVAQRVAQTARQLRLSRFDLKYASGTMSHAQLMGSIERIGAVVAPRVRALLAEDPAVRAAG